MSDHRPDIDVLMTRLIDGEASDDDRALFETLAAEQPQLRRALDDARGEFAMLAGALETRVDRMCAVELPGDAAPQVETIRRSWWLTPLAASGWAAAILLAVVWMVTSGRSNPVDTTRVDREPVSSYSPDEHFELYLRAGELAGFVTGEMAPYVVSITELEDGRYQIRYVRRVEEIAVIEGELPVDENSHLTVDVASLRE